MFEMIDLYEVPSLKFSQDQRSTSKTVFSEQSFIHSFIVIVSLLHQIHNKLSETFKQ